MSEKNIFGRNVSTGQKKKKIVLKYDDEARTEFLKGFSKRKKEKRIQMLEKRALRALKEKKDNRKHINATKRMQAEKVDALLPDPIKERDEALFGNRKKVVEETVSSDFAQSAFGNSLVTITVASLDNNSDNEDDNEGDNSRVYGNGSNEDSDDEEDEEGGEDEEDEGDDGGSEKAKVGSKRKRSEHDTSNVDVVLSAKIKKRIRNDVVNNKKVAGSSKKLRRKFSSKGDGDDKKGGKGGKGKEGKGKGGKGKGGKGKKH